MQVLHKRSIRPTRPTILVIQPFREIGDMICDDLSELDVMVIVVPTRAAALAALVHRPDIVILDVVMSQIDSRYCRERLQKCLIDGLFSHDAYMADLHQLKLDIFAEEQERGGIALAQQIQRHLPGVPVIFTSTEPLCLRSLPFGESFCWWRDKSESLLSMVERIVSMHLPSHQPAHRETVDVIELPRMAEKSPMRVAA